MRWPQTKIAERTDAAGPRAHRGPAAGGGRRRRHPDPQPARRPASNWCSKACRARACRRACIADIASLERTVRLYQVLGDPKLLDAYRDTDQSLASDAHAARAAARRRTHAPQPRRLRGHAQRDRAGRELDAAGQRRLRHHPGALRPAQRPRRRHRRERQHARSTRASRSCSGRPRARSGACSGSPRCSCRSRSSPSSR